MRFSPSHRTLAVFSMETVMTHVTSRVRTVCLGVIASLVLGSASPAWAQEDPPDLTDPTIVEEESSSAPTGVKDLKVERDAEKRLIKDPIYGEWWFWGSVIVAAGAWIAFSSLVPLHKKAGSCYVNSNGQAAFPLGCVGDGR